ncbi:substrate-binding periplasmic protein [Desulfovibrio gilichinskyi]|nr:transporter substrate-binding domain-containing protein [Desulfovibrio gilichinskyi]
MLCFIIFPGYALADADKKVVLSTLEWPPYTGEKLPDKGRISKLVKAAFNAMGYKVEFRFTPWKRAIRNVQKSQDILGYFPEYYSAARAQDFIFSDSIGCSPIGVLMRVEKPVLWDSVADLSKYRIGLVSGYVNTADLDELVVKGKMDIDYAPSDDSNIKKVIRNRIHGAVVDVNVYNYISLADSDVTKFRTKLTFFNKLLGINRLYVCFRNNKKGQRLTRIFNEGLKKIGSANPNYDKCN